MGYSGKLDLKLKARSLRKNGFSIKEIQKKLKISRSSASIWVRDIKMTKAQIKKLYANKRTGGLKGSFIAAKNKIEERKRKIDSFLNLGKKEIGRLLKRDKFIAGVSMYFAEGNKADGTVSFSNSDAKALKFMKGWFDKFCGVHKDRYRCYLYIHDNLNEQNAKIFWSNLLNIPLEQFRKSYIVKNNQKRFRKTKHEYGVLRLSVSDINLHRKIMGWISGLLK